MLQIPVDLALDFVRQLIATQLGSQPTGPPITLAEIRERTGAKKTTSDLALKRAVLRVAFERIRAA
ncbi:hypothetical protein HZA87_00665 [Candidatus Uhrbacteria bacterium]|nr:hypothetical protein [Candidatus Uhrbacteria bacterium]